MTKKSKATFESLIEKAWSKFSKKDFDTSLQLFEDILEEDPKHAGAIFGRASVFMRTEDYESAINDFNALIKADGNNSKAYHGRGLAFGAEQNHKGALSDLQAASNLDPENVEIWSDMGGAFLVMEDYKNASRCFKNCTDLDKKCPLGWYGNGVVALMQNDFNKAVEFLNTAIKLDPQFISALIARAEANFGLKKPEQALKDIQKATEIQPDILKMSDQSEGHESDEFGYDADEDNSMDDDAEIDEY